MDLLGLIVGSLELTLVFALIASFLGSLLGLSIILRRSRTASLAPGADLTIVSGDDQARP
jgi:hypothetical protein